MRMTKLIEKTTTDAIVDTLLLQCLSQLFLRPVHVLAHLLLLVLYLVFPFTCPDQLVKDSKGNEDLNLVLVY